MQIENEVFQFKKNIDTAQNVLNLSALQYQYLKILAHQTSLKNLIFNLLNQKKRVDYSQLYDLLQKLTQFDFLLNPCINEYFLDEKIEVPKPSVLQNTFSTDKLIPYLTQLPFFRSLSESELDLLLKVSEIHQYAPETYICKRGDVFSRYLYVMLSGQAAIYGQGVHTKKFISLIKESTVFGEMGFFLGVPRSADIITIKQSQVLVITGHTDFMEKYLQLQTNSISDVQNENQIDLSVKYSLVHRFWIQQALLNSELFKSVPSEVIDDLTHDGDIVKISQNRILFNQGDLSNGAYIVIQGQLSIVLHQKIIAEILPGQMIGEMSLFQEKGLRTVTVISAKDSVLVHIQLQKFYELLSQNLLLAKTLQELAQARFIENQKRLK